VAISQLRVASLRQRHVVPLDEALHDLADAGNDHEAAHGMRELQRVIDTLEPLNRALLLLYLEERSQREIGEILGIGESNVATKINRLKQRIRNQFNDAT
jgi:RNA polymerase sigma-70 factor (ECF subfamily)